MARRAAGASAIHHIVDEDVKDAPSPGDVAGRFKGADFYVAHNCEFERSFFAADGIELGPWICTYKCAFRVWPELEAIAIKSSATPLDDRALSPVLIAARSFAPRRL
jgi:DNA polymerase III epsilon subunit-like protein